jgi:hypothetical protein
MESNCIGCNETMDYIGRYVECDTCNKYLCRDCWKGKKVNITMVEFYNRGTDYHEGACMECLKTHFPFIKEALEVYPNYGKITIE